MSDREDSLERRNGESVNGDDVAEEDERSDVDESPKRSHRKKRGRKSRSRSKSDNSRERERPRKRRPARQSRSRSGSASPLAYRRSRGGAARSPSRSRSPYWNRQRHYGTRDEPEPSRCLGVFGMSLYTNERDLKDLFGQFGPIEKVQIVYDHPTGRSRGFGFIYFEHTEDAIEAKEKATGTEIDGHKVRIDYSITKRAHTPTPGCYMGGAEGVPRRVTIERDVDRAVTTETITERSLADFTKQNNMNNSHKNGRFVCACFSLQIHSRRLTVNYTESVLKTWEKTEV